MTAAVFGSAGSLAPDVGMLAFLMVIACVVGIEVLFHHLHEQTKETRYQHMLSAMEKELMIAGFMAFVLKIILNTTTIADESWILAIEFAGKYKIDSFGFV